MTSKISRTSCFSLVLELIVEVTMSASMPGSSRDRAMADISWGRADDMETTFSYWLTRLAMMASISLFLYSSGCMVLILALR